MGRLTTCSPPLQHPSPANMGKITTCPPRFTQSFVSSHNPLSLHTILCSTYGKLQVAFGVGSLYHNTVKENKEMFMHKWTVTVDSKNLLKSYLTHVNFCVLSSKNYRWWSGSFKKTPWAYCMSQKIWRTSVPKKVEHKHFFKKHNISVNIEIIT